MCKQGVDKSFSWVSVISSQTKYLRHLWYAEINSKDIQSPSSSTTFPAHFQWQQNSSMGMIVPGNSWRTGLNSHFSVSKAEFSQSSRHSVKQSFGMKCNSRLGNKAIFFYQHTGTHRYIMWSNGYHSKHLQSSRIVDWVIFLSYLFLPTRHWAIWGTFQYILGFFKVFKAFIL